MKYVSVVVVSWLFIGQGALGDDLTAAQCRLIAAPVVLQTSSEERSEDLQRERRIRRMVEQDVSDLRRLRASLIPAERAYFRARAEGLDVTEPRGLAGRIERLQRSVFEIECRSPADFRGRLPHSLPETHLRRFCGLRGRETPDFRTLLTFGRSYRAAWRQGTVVGINRLDSLRGRSRRHFSVYVDLATGDVMNADLEFVRNSVDAGGQRTWGVRAMGSKRDGTAGIVEAVEPLSDYVDREMARVCGAPAGPTETQALSTALSPQVSQVEAAGQADSDPAGAHAAL